MRQGSEKRYDYSRVGKSACRAADSRVWNTKGTRYGKTRGYRGMRATVGLRSKLGCHPTVLPPIATLMRNFRSPHSFSRFFFSNHSAAPVFPLSQLLVPFRPSGYPLSTSHPLPRFHFFYKRLVIIFHRETHPAPSSPFSFRIPRSTDACAIGWIEKKFVLFFFFWFPEIKKAGKN